MRALAITLVIGGHILPHHPNAWMRAIFAGQDGVGLFFVLSGFLVTALLLRERMETGGVDIAHFYFRRAFRIVPPLLFYLVAVMCIGWVEGDPIPLRVVSSVVFFYHNMTHEGTWMLEHTWSLAVEEQFYLLWPLLFVLLLRLSWRALIWTIVSLILLTPLFRMGGASSALGMDAPQGIFPARYAHGLTLIRLPGGMPAGNAALRILVQAAGASLLDCSGVSLYRLADDRAAPLVPMGLSDWIYAELDCGSIFHLVAQPE